MLGLGIHGSKLLAHVPVRDSRFDVGVAIDAEARPFVKGDHVFLRGELGMAKKFASPQTRLEPVMVNDHSGMWISGAPHVVMYFDSQGRGIAKNVRIAGNTLVWAYGSVTLRIEGPITRAKALALAASIR